MKRTTYRYSSGQAWLGLMLVALGSGAGGFCVSSALREPDIAGGVIGLAIALGFGGPGIAILLKVLVDRIEVSERGIRKWSAPFGALTFQCLWEDVVSYQGWDDPGTRYNVGIRTYRIQSLSSQLDINGYAPFFPRLHSHILSMLPAKARATIPGKHAPGDGSIRPVRSWTLGSARRFGWPVALFFLVAGGLLISFSMGDFDMVNGRAPTEEEKQLWRTALSVAGGLLCLFSLSRFLGGRSNTVKLTTEGIERWAGRRKLAAIRWDDMRSVEPLYTYYDRYRYHDNDDGPTLHVVTGPMKVDYAAIIGAGGNAICFDSTMEDFQGFLSLLGRAAPAHVVIPGGLPVNG